MNASWNLSNGNQGFFQIQCDEKPLLGLGLCSTLEEERITVVLFQKSLTISFFGQDKLVVMDSQVKKVRASSEVVVQVLSDLVGVDL